MACSFLEWQKRWGHTLEKVGVKFSENRQLRYFPGTALKKEDVRILEELGERLGAADVHSQLQMLQLAEERAEFQKGKAQEEYRQKGKMARYLGICMGLFFVVLFF